MTVRTRCRGLIRIAAAATALAALTACGQIYPSKEPAQGPAGGVQPDVNQVVIGFAQQQLQAPYFAAMQVQAEEIAQEQGFTLLLQAANKDPVVQMNQMQAMMTQGANVMLVNATSPKGQVAMTQISSEIPVIYIDTSVPGTGTTSVQSDNLAIGKESGKLTAARFKKLGKDNINMVILTGPATDEVVGPSHRPGVPRSAVHVGGGQSARQRGWGVLRSSLWSLLGMRWNHRILLEKRYDRSLVTRPQPLGVTDHYLATEQTRERVDTGLLRAGGGFVPSDGGHIEW